MPFAEFRDIRGSEPLRQGDVLEAINPAASMWERHLFVLTADCDLSHDKHHGRITCVPLLGHEEYLLELQLPKLRERFAQKSVAELQAAFAKAGSPNLSDERVREWVGSASTDQVLAALEIDGEDAELCSLIMDGLRLLDGPLGSLKEAIEVLLQAQLSSAQPPKRANALERIHAPLRQAYSNPPGDALFLSAIGPSLDSGYFAYLRHLEQIWEPSIALGPTYREVSYRRISRLDDRYTHSLVQRFAMVFMPIGLPKEYETARDLRSEKIGEMAK